MDVKKGHSRKRRVGESLEPTAHWSRHVYTRMNWLLRPLLTSRFHGVASARLALLRITGRRSGRRYEIAVGYVQDGDELVILVSDAANRTWWRNFVDGGPVGVVVRGSSRKGWATVHRPPDAEFKRLADRALPRMLDRDGVRKVFGIAGFDRREGLTDEQLRWLDGFAVAVRVDLKPEAADTSSGPADATGP